MIKYLSLFSGIGAFEKALKNNSIDYKLVGFSEIDKYATKSYCAVHGVDESLNLGDVSKIDLAKLKDLDIDLITHGSPCQDFSIAGRLAGGDKGSGTRSSLMWCTVDIVEAVRPKYVVWENVKNLLSAKNRHNFDGYLEIMDKLGYNSYYKVLNSKHYGIPQNRERVFTVSIRKDIDSGYEFPEEIELTKKLKDVLEKDVDEKYYLSDKLIAGLIANTERQREKGNGFAFETTDGDCVAKTVTTRVGACRSGDNYIQVVGKLDIKGHDCVKRVYSGEGLAPTLTDMQGGNRQPKIIVDEPVIAASRGRNPDNPGDRTPGIPTEQRLEINKQGISNTITTVQKDNYVIEPCLKIKEATKAGYKEAYAGDGVNISGRMKYQRGNVQKEMTQTLMANGSERGVVVTDDRNEDLLFTIFDLCSIINQKETEKYERSREILQILWKEIGKKEIWQEIRRFYSIQKEEILQSKLYEKSISKSGELSTKLSPSSSDSSEHIEKFINREKMLNMWKNWKTRYPSQRWELSEQQFDEFNLFMQELSSETAPNEISMYNMWKTDERFRLLQQTLSEIQKIWRPIKDEIPSGLRIRKLSPRECWRLMGFGDEDFDKAQAVPTSDTQLYKQAGNSIVVNVLEAVFRNLFGVEKEKKSWYK